MGKRKGKVIDMATKELELKRTMPKTTPSGDWDALRALAQKSGASADDVMKKLQEYRQQRRAKS